MFLHKKHLFLQLYNGESFEDMNDNRTVAKKGNALYRRESFGLKEIMIPFDATFNRMDDETMRNQYVGKNLAELRHTIDSVNVKVDSIGNTIALHFLREPVCGAPIRKRVVVDGKNKEVPMSVSSIVKPMDLDSIFAEIEKNKRKN